MIERPLPHASGEQIDLDVSQFQLRSQHVPLLARRAVCRPIPPSHSTSTAASALHTHTSRVATARDVLAPLAHFPAHVLEEDVVVHHGPMRVAVHRYQLCHVTHAGTTRVRFVRDGAWLGTRPSRASRACVDRDTRRTHRAVREGRGMTRLGRSGLGWANHRQNRGPCWSDLGS